MSLKSLMDYTFVSKYARWIPEKKRRETWNEAVDRVKQMMLEQYADKPEVAEEIEWAYEQNVSTLDPSAGHPGGKSVVVVVASVDLASIGSGLGHFDYRSTPKFSAPDHQSVVKHSTLLEIVQHPRA